MPYTNEFSDLRELLASLVKASNEFEQRYDDDNEDMRHSLEDLTSAVRKADGAAWDLLDALDRDTEWCSSTEMSNGRTVKCVLKAGNHSKHYAWQGGPSWS